MKLLDVVCEELGVEIGEEWTGNDGWRYMICGSGRIVYFEPGRGWKKLHDHEKILAGDLRPVWEPRGGRDVLLSVYRQRCGRKI